MGNGGAGTALLVDAQPERRRRIGDAMRSALAGHAWTVQPFPSELNVTTADGGTTDGGTTDGVDAEVLLVVVDGESSSRDVPPPWDPLTVASRLFADRGLPLLVLIADSVQPGGPVWAAIDRLDPVGCLPVDLAPHLLARAILTAARRHAGGTHGPDAHGPDARPRNRFPRRTTAAPTGEVYGVVGATPPTDTEEAPRDAGPTAPVGVRGMDADGTIRFWNGASERLFGYRAEEVVGRSLLETLVSATSQPMVVDAIQRALEGADDPVVLEWKAVGRDATVVDLLSYHIAVRSSRGERHVLALDYEKRAGHRAPGSALRSASGSAPLREHEYRLLVEKQRDLLVKVDRDNRFEFVSESYCRLFGKSREELLGRSFVPLIHEEDRAATELAMQSLFEPPHECLLEQRALTVHGWRWLEWHDSAVLDDDGEVTAIVGSGRDITDRKQAEAQLAAGERRQRMILDQLPVPVVISTGAAEEVLSVNRRFRELFGYDATDIPDVNHWFRLAYPDPEYRRRVATEWAQQRDRTASDAGTIGPVRADVTCKDGRVLHVAIVGHAVEDLYMIVFSDYTQVNTIQRHLQETIREKDDLMKELNHRVKNNLSLVSSLINLKDEALGTRADLADIRGQIDAIGFIHERLYNTSDTVTIQFGSYVQTLLESAFSFHRTSPVHIDNGIPDLQIPTKVAVTLGVIINELATNAMKHGFSSDADARFSVALRPEPEENQCTLTVSNSGNRFPEEVDVRRADTLGLRLVSSLVEQLHGSVTLSRDPITSFTIRFRCPSDESRR